MRRTLQVVLLTAVLVLASACPSDVINGQGSTAGSAGSGTASPGPMAPTSSPTPTAGTPAPSSRPPANGLVFRFAGRANSVTIVISTDGDTTALTGVRLPWRYVVDGTARDYEVTALFTDGRVTCTVTTAAGVQITTSSAGGTGNSRIRLRCGASR